MKSAYHTIYLSPHLDDVALSCGGQVYMLAEAGKPVLIATVMAGDPPRRSPSAYAKSLHDRWQFQTDAAARRRAEDARACRILGADHLYWDIPDCIYRSHPEADMPLYNSDEDIFGDIHETEMNLVGRIAGYIRALPQCERIAAPLAVGHHVDHQLTRLAAEQANGRSLIYYEEYPYARDAGAVEKVAQKQGLPLEAAFIPLTEDALRAKIQAIAAFESQLSTFFRDLNDMEDDVRQFNKSTGGERIWRRVSNR